MENIYQICNRCEHGKISKYPKTNIYINFTILILVIIAAYFFFSAAAQIIADKLVDKEIKLIDPAAKQVLWSFFIIAIIMLPAYYFYNIVTHLRSWLTKDCPYCESGYIIAQRTSNMQAIIYFFDLFLFQQILIPMYKTVTLQFIWKENKKRHILEKISKFIFYAALFFGAIPFIIFLLGRDRISGLMISIFVMIYILYLIFFGNKEERTYQQGTIFLIIPLYYVCMVEIFRWAWFLSAKDMSFIPDQSVFLWMGLENLIRTQLFLDLFEVYDLGMVTIDTTTFVTHSSIFITRLIIDVALIAMLIQMASESYRRAWYFKFTGEKKQDITDSEALGNLENLTTTGSPRNIVDVKENLDKVLQVVAGAKPYIKSVAEIAIDSEDKKIAHECNEKILGITTVLDKKEPGTLQGYFLQRILAILCVCIWIFSFSFGVNKFITDVTSHEIELLMTSAEKDQFSLDPIARQNFYLKAISKNNYYHPALWKSAETYIEMAKANLNLLDADMAINNIEKYFLQVSVLQKLPIYEKAYLDLVTTVEVEAYKIRGISFLLQERTDLALGELGRRKNQENARIMFNIMLIQTSLNIFTPEAKSYFDKAYSELGFDPENPSLLYAKLLQTIYDGHSGNWLRVVSTLDKMIEQIEQPDLKHSFMLYFAQVSLRLGNKYWFLAEKYFLHILSLFPENTEALIGLSNTYRLQQSEKAITIFNDKNVLPEIKLTLATLHILKNENEQAQKYLDHINGYSIRERLKTAVIQYLDKKMSEQDVIEMTYSWDIHLMNRQRSFAYYYIALQNIQQKKFGKAADFLRQIIFSNQHELLEYHQAKWELENLQIQLERKSYQPKLFFTTSYFDHLNKQIQVELQKVISPEEKAMHGLELIMNSNYLQNQVNALKALTLKQIIRPVNFYPYLEQALQKEHDQLTLVALEGFLSIGNHSYASRDTIVKNLYHESENIRLLCVKIFSTWDKEAIPFLEESLNNDNYYVRRDAAYVFAQLGKKAFSSLKLLQKTLADPEIIVKQAVFAAIKHIGYPENKETLFDIALYQDSDVLRLQAFLEIEKHNDDFFTMHKEKIVPFLVTTLTTDKDIQNRKWAAIRILKYQDEKIINAPQTKPQMEDKISQAMKSIDLEERLIAAIWLLNTYDIWEQSYQDAIAVIIERWELGDDGDQFNVVQKIIKNTAVEKHLLILEHTFSVKDKRARDGVKVFAQEMILHDNFATIGTKALYLLLQVTEKISDSQLDSKELISFALDKKFEVCFPILLQFFAEDKIKTPGFIGDIVLEKSRRYTGSEKDIIAIQQALAIQPLMQTMSQICYHLKISDNNLFTSYAKLLEQKEPALLIKSIELIAMYTSKKKEVILLFDHLAKRLETQTANQKEFLIVHDNLLKFWGSLLSMDEYYKVSQKYLFLEAKAPLIISDIQKISAKSLSDITPFLFLWMQSKNKNTVVNAMRQLLDLKVWPASALTSMFDLVQANDPEVSAEAQRILLEMTSIYSVEDLKIWLADENPKIRISAVRAIAKMGTRAQELFPLLADLLASPNEELQEAVVVTFSQLGKPIFSYLETAFRKTKQEKKNAIKALKEMPKKLSEDVVSLLSMHIGEKEDELTIFMLEALEKHASIVFQPILLPALQKLNLQQEKNEIMYWNLMCVLGERQIALAKLTSLMENTTVNKKDILGRLVLLSPDYVIKYLKNAMQLRYDQINIIEAITTLEKLKNAQASLIILEEIARDQNPIVKNKAMEAIRFIKENN